MRFGYLESDLRALRFNPAFADLMRFEVERVQALFALGRALVPRIPRALAVDIDLFSRGGLAVLDRIEARGFDVLSARPTLRPWTKLLLVGRALAAILMARLRGKLLSSRALDGAHGAPYGTASASPRGENPP
jgi:phytoene/squalene synthetase